MPNLLARGATGPVVADIRARLHGLGFLCPGTPNFDASSDRFDDECDRAVRAFQQHRGLTVDGVVGPQTYRALDEARWQLGDRLLHYRATSPYTGDDVLALQRRLSDLGFDVGRCDGIFGAATETALREFQRNVGLAPDGTFGPTTIRAMAQLRRAVVGGRPTALREREALHRAGHTLAGKVVIVDPAHGGDDAGAEAGEHREADIVYDIAARLEGRLAAAGALAFLTRSADGSPSQPDRAAFANAAEADIFVSLHVDAAPSARANGAAAFHYGAAGEVSAIGERLADLVCREIVARTDLLDCGTHGRSWELLRMTRMPAVQIEIGYLTNPSDRARLAQPAFRDTVAEAILAALQRLFLPVDDDPGTGQLRLPALA